MKQYYPKEGLEVLCRLFGFSRQAYYKTHAIGDQTAIKEAIIVDLVKDQRKTMPRIGCRKLRHLIASDLEGHHIRMGRDKFGDLLRDNDLLVKARKRYYVRTTDSRHPYYKWSDLTPGLILKGPHRLWVSDITYLRSAQEGFLYLSLITDAFSRKIVGHHLSHSLSAKGCVRALCKAIGQLPERNRPQLIHHSDRGIQYCSQDYVSVLQKEGISISMTQNGSPYENALAERVNGILKTELGLVVEFDNYSAAIRAVSAAIDTYNRIRPHLALDMLTPENAHQLSSTGPNQPINPKQPRSEKAHCQPMQVLS
jgi:putative transposase